MSATARQRGPENLGTEDRRAGAVSGAGRGVSGAGEAIPEEARARVGGAGCTALPAPGSRLGARRPRPRPLRAGGRARHYPRPAAAFLAQGGLGRPQGNFRTLRKPPSGPAP